MLGDVDGDGIGDLGVGWGYHDSSNGAVVVYLGPLSGAKDATDWDGFVAGSGGAFGVHNESLAGPGDVDGDGTPDILVGAPETHIDSTSEGTNAGSAWLISGASALAETDVRLAMATFQGHLHGQALGRTVASIGDQEGDGFAEVLIGASTDDFEADNGGSAGLFYGPVSGTVTRLDADAVWGAGEDHAGAGFSLAGGVDLTGDVYADLAIGAYAATGGSSWSGVVYVVPGLMP